MKYDVTIDEKLFETYSDIRLGLMRFDADVNNSDENFWRYMDTELLPQIRASIEGKQLSLIHISEPTRP